MPAFLAVENDVQAPAPGSASRSLEEDAPQGFAEKLLEKRIPSKPLQDETMQTDVVPSTAPLWVFEPAAVKLQPLIPSSANPSILANPA